MKKLNTKSKPRRTFLVIAVMLAMSICLSGVHANAAGRDRVLTVMTRNMDTGTDFGPIFSATTALQLLTAVGAAYAEVQASNIPERAAGTKQIHRSYFGRENLTAPFPFVRGLALLAKRTLLLASCRQ